jgi:hypothetical protein
MAAMNLLSGWHAYCIYFLKQNMNKRIITAILIGAAGAAIYLFTKSIKEKRRKSLQKRADKLRRKPKSPYAYEYTL